MCFFSFLYKRIFIAFFLLETEQGRQAGAGSDMGSRPSMTKPRGCRSPRVPVGTWSGWAHGMGAHQGSGAETTRGKARRGEGGDEHPVAWERQHLWQRVGHRGSRVARGGRGDTLEHDAGYPRAWGGL